MIKPPRKKHKDSDATRSIKSKIAGIKGTLEKNTREIDASAYRPGMGSEFYQTSAWRELRWQVLKESKQECALCGSVKKPFHCDHIKPRSKFPHLELVKKNLQVLCEDCNLGKGDSI